MFRANIFRQELILSRRGLITWTCVVVAVIAIYLGFFPYMQDPAMVAAMEAYPEAVMSALNMSTAMFSNVNSYHGGLVMLYATLLGSIYAFMLAGGLIARDSDLGTAEFLYTRPVTRSQVMVAKVLVFLVAMVILWVVAFVASAVVGLAVAPDDFDLWAQVGVHLAALLATLAAGGSAFAVGPYVNQLQQTTTLGVGVGMGFFLLDALSNLSDRLGGLKYVSVYHYAGLERAASGDLFVGGLLLLFGVFVVGCGLGFVGMSRKEFSA